jgi:hypothetical protein
MPVTIDSTIGGVSSNSYSSLADANAYFATSFGRTNWSSANDDNKSICLIEATRQIDLLFDWIGLINDIEQALDWPRKTEDFRDIDKTDFSDIGYGYQLDKNPCDGVTIPQDLKIAVYELAYSILSNGFSIDEQLVDSIKIASISIKLNNDIRATTLPKIVIESLRKLGIYRVVASNQVSTAMLVRT